MLGATLSILCLKHILCCSFQSMNECRVSVCTYFIRIQRCDEIILHSAVLAQFFCLLLHGDLLTIYYQKSDNVLLVLVFTRWFSCLQFTLNCH